MKVLSDDATILHQPLANTPTTVPETSSTNLTYTPCKTPKPKYQYSSQGESLKSRVFKYPPLQV